jgi:tetratricopeptide (TPR) repeat protein
MSRRRGRERGGKAAATRPPRPRRTRFPRWLAWAVPALLVAGALLWGPVHRLTRGPAARRDGPPEPEFLAGMDAEQALQAGIALGRSGRDLQSLAYLRHAIRSGRGDLWQARYNYATALYNVTLRIEPRNGVPTYVVRSSWERIAMVREAIQQLDLAEGLTRSPRDRAIVRAASAQMLWLWGMPWNAFVAYRQAAAADPANRDVAVRGDGLMDLIRAPAAGTGATGVPPGRPTARLDPAPATRPRGHGPGDDDRP